MNWKTEHKELIFVLAPRLFAHIKSSLTKISCDDSFWTATRTQIIPRNRPHAHGSNLVVLFDFWICCIRRTVGTSAVRLRFLTGHDIYVETAPVSAFQGPPILHEEICRRLAIVVYVGGIGMLPLRYDIQLDWWVDDYGLGWPYGWLDVWLLGWKDGCDDGTVNG